MARRAKAYPLLACIGPAMAREILSKIGRSPIWAIIDCVSAPSSRAAKPGKVAQSHRARPMLQTLDPYRKTHRVVVPAKVKMKPERS
jgi:hypothetical protein